LAVARAEVDDVVLRRGLRHAQHLVDEFVGRRHPDDVLAALAYLGLVSRFTVGSILGLSQGAEGDEQDRACASDRSNAGDGWQRHAVLFGWWFFARTVPAGTVEGRRRSKRRRILPQTPFRPAHRLGGIRNRLPVGSSAGLCRSNVERQAPQTLSV